MSAAPQTETVERRPQPIASKRRETLQLLRDYRPFMTAGGAAMVADDSQVKDVSYGPGGIVLEGDDFRHLSAGEVILLGRSLRVIERETTRLATVDRTAYVSLLMPFLGDPADSSLYDKWRDSERSERLPRITKLRHAREVANIEIAVEIISRRTQCMEMFCDYPTRSRHRAPRNRDHDEAWRVFKTVLDDGGSTTEAVAAAKETTGFSESTIYRLKRLREALNE